MFLGDTYRIPRPGGGGTGWWWTEVLGDVIQNCEPPPLSAQNVNFLEKEIIQITTIKKTVQKYFCCC